MTTVFVTWEDDYELSTFHDVFTTLELAKADHPSAAWEHLDFDRLPPRSWYCADPDHHCHAVISERELDPPPISGPKT